LERILCLTEFFFGLNIYHGNFNGEVRDRDDIAGGYPGPVYGLAIEKCLVGRIEILEHPGPIIRTEDHSMLLGNRATWQYNLIVITSAYVNGIIVESVFLRPSILPYDCQSHLSILQEGTCYHAFALWHNPSGVSRNPCKPEGFLRPTQQKGCNKTGIYLQSAN
jgi:hypothetical protein